MITPHQEQKKLAEALGLGDIYFKREDLHPYGSHKGRSIPVMIDHYRHSGKNEFVISSSGNAALAAALYVRELNARAPSPELTQNEPAATKPVQLDIFVGNHIAPHKLEKLKNLADDNIRVLIRERPLQALNKSIEEGLTSLRQSTDDAALIGYESLAEELAAIPNIGAVFMGASSGTTAQALAAHFLKDPTTAKIQVHIVQTSSCHPLSDAFETCDDPDELSLADAIVDLTARRKSALIPLIEKTGGHGWCASNEEITTAQELVTKDCGLDISTNSALSIVGAMQAAYTGYEIEGVVVCMICGD